MALQKPYLKDDEVTCDNLEAYLENDISFVQFFNSFLTLPVFPQRLIYNIVTGIFEQFKNTLTDSNNHDLKQQSLKNQSNASNSKQSLKSLSGGTSPNTAKIAYHVKYLSRSDGIAWVKKERLQLFLKSEIYADFKLSRLLGEAQSRFLLKLASSSINDGGNIVVPLDAESCSGVDSKQQLVDGIDVSKLPLWQRNQVLINNGLYPDDDSDTENHLDESSSTASSEIFLRSKNQFKDRSKSFVLYNVEEDPKESEKEDDIKDVPVDYDKSSELYTCAKQNVELENRRTPMTSSHFDIQNEEESGEETKVELWLRKMSRRKSTAEVRDEVLVNGLSHMEVQCDDTYINEVLTSSNQAAIQPIQEGTLEFLKKAELYPINLSYKQGIDAFKEFLFETQGERNLLLWTEIERSKYLDGEERKRVLQRIKDYFIRSGSPFQIAIPIWKKWGVKSLSDISIDKLIDVSPKVLRSLINYWCQRFTIHQHRRKNQFIHNAILTANAMSKQDLPQRPRTGFKHYNVYKNDASSDCSSDSGIVSEDSSSTDLHENGITRNNLRCKSAFPRILSTKLPHNTNVGYDQLQLISSSRDEGFGFKPPSSKSFRNDAASADEKKNVRLYMAPIPPSNCNVSTLLSDEKTHQNHESLSQENTEDCIHLLVDMLVHESFTGEYFLKHLQELSNTHWINCYMFWNAVKDYGDFFYSHSFNPFAVQRKANTIFMTFICEDGEQYIKCPKPLQHEVTKKIHPPFEELFDKIESFALNELIAPWKILIETENKEFARVKMRDEVRYIEVNRKTKYNNEYDKNGQHSDKDTDDWLKDGRVKDTDQKISPEEMTSPLPSTKDPFNFDLLIRNKSELEFFQMFLESKHREGTKDLTAWTDMELFRKLPHTFKEDRHEKAMEIRKKWLSSKYFFGKDTPATNSALKKILEMSGKGASSLPDRPSTPVISEAQKYIRARVERRWLILFKETTEYLQRRKRKISVSEIVEDLIMKKKIQRSEHAWKVLNSRWNSSSRDITALRLALNDPVQCEQFRRFISVKSDMMCNNLHFWLEVQKYKDLCHNHVHPSIIQEKLKAVIDVFIKSQIPPELQIDVPIEMAERLHDKVFGKNPYHGPYLFRETQTTVFRIMFNHWKEFLSYRNELSESEPLSLSLLALEKKHHDDVMKKKLEVERKRLKKLVNEKKKKKNTAKDSSKPSQDLFSYLSKTVAETNTDMESTLFLYSQHAAERELTAVESAMEEHGFLTSDIVALEEFNQKRNSKISLRNSIADSLVSRTDELVKQSQERSASMQSTNKLFPINENKTKTRSKQLVESRNSFSPISPPMTNLRRASKNKILKETHIIQSPHLAEFTENRPTSSIQKLSRTGGVNIHKVIPTITIDANEEDSDRQLSTNTRKSPNPIVRKVRIPRNSGTAVLKNRLKCEKRTISADVTHEIKAEVIVC